MPHTCSAEAFSCKPNIFRIKRTRFAFSAATSSITDVLPVALAMPASSRYTSSLGTRSMAAISVNASSRSIKNCFFFLPHAHCSAASRRLLRAEARYIGCRSLGKVRRQLLATKQAFLRSYFLHHRHGIHGRPAHCLVDCFSKSNG